METKLTRREARENAFIAAFSATFQTEDTDEALTAHGEDGELILDAYSQRLLRDMQAHAGDIDAMIVPYLKGWTLGRIPRVSLVAIRLALAELLYGDEKKSAVSINEAVELVKKYGAENDYQFVNGLLGSVVRGMNGGAAPAAGDIPAEAAPAAQGEAASPETC